MTGLGTLEKAINILNFLAEKEKSAGIREISRAIKINPSTVSRVLYTLKKARLVKQNKSRTYTLGVRLFELGSIYLKHFRTADIAHRVLEWLVEESNETANFTIYDNGERVCIDRVESPRSVRTTLFIGKRELLHRSAAGKAMMAFLPEDELQCIIETKGLPAYTNKTITDPKSLKKELETIRLLGYAIDECESEEDVCCVGAPVLDLYGKVVGALSLSIPAYRITGDWFSKWGLIIKEKAKELSCALGWVEK